MAAGARLETMQRRVRLSRLALWTAIAAGPVALGVAITSTPATVEAATPAKPTAVRTTAVVTDPAGHAQLFIHAWLRSSTDDPTSAQARLAQSMAPGIELPEKAAHAQPVPQSVTAVRSVQRGHGAWSVTVAAQYADGTVRYYSVPLAADGAGDSFAVTGQPSVVAGPARAEAARTPYRVSVPESDLSAAVGEFLAAYLTGAGEIGRYLAPGVTLTPLSPALYSALSVEEVSAVEDTAAAEHMPSDGTKVRVLAQVEARDSDGTWPLAYQLALTARSGRWEVSALEAGLNTHGGR
jgi:hypothetical protein